MKQAFVIVFAVGLLVGGAQGAALAQNAGAHSAPQGSQGYGLPVPSYPPDAYRPMDTTQPGWMHSSQQSKQSVGAPPVAQGSRGYGLPVPSYPPDAYRPMDTTQPGWVHTSSQVELTVDGKIAAVDLSRKILTLDDGEQFTLPMNLEYSTLPTLGQEVELTFAEQNGQKVVRWIDLDDTADSHDNS